MISPSQSPTLANYDAPVKLLDPRSETGVADYKPNQGLRMWAATVSAGWKEGDRPVVVRDGKIRLHEDMGDAPGLRQALAATEHKHITITMLSDDIGTCIKQLFCAYGKVKIFGDETGLTVMKMEGERQVRKTVRPGEAGWKELLDQCKASTFVPFALAAWDKDGNPFLHWPDGLIPYRLRFGSMNSARGFVDSLSAIKQLTRGHLVGVPLTLSITYKDVLTPDLKRQKVPVWSLVLKHPTGLPMGSKDIARMLTAGIQDAQQMALPESIDLDPELVHAADEKIESELEQIAERQERAVKVATTESDTTETRIADYFRAMQGTPFVKDELRPMLVERCATFAGLQLDRPSLRLLAEVATAEEWQICAETFVKTAAECHGTETPKEAKAVVDEENPFGDDNKGASEPPAGQQDQQGAESLTAPAGSEPKPGPKLPTVKNYLALDRAPTPEEIDAARQYGSDHLSDSQFQALAKASGGIDVHFAILQARKQGKTAFGDIMRVVNEDFKEEEGALPL